jgi:uncharacterized protein (DUF433 family)
MKLMETVRSSSGLYTVGEAANFAKMPVATLNYWLYGDKARPSLHQPMIGQEEGKFLTFYEFVEALAIRTLRNSYKLSLQKIRAGLEEAKQAYKIDYPFANKEHKTVIIGGDLHIFIGESENPVQLTGKGKKQQSLRPCIEQFMRDLEFDEKKMAKAYIAYRYPVPNEARTINVMMNPKFCFGEPVVDGTPHRAETLWRAALAEGSEERAAEIYEVDLPQVIAACRYCEDIELSA